MKKKPDIEKAFSVIFGTWGSFCSFEFRVIERLDNKWGAFVAFGHIKFI